MSGMGRPKRGNSYQPLAWLIGFAIFMWLMLDFVAHTPPQ